MLCSPARSIRPFTGSSARSFAWSLALLGGLTLGFAPAIFADDPPPMVLGQCGVEALQAEPFDEWYTPGYDDYTPNTAILDKLAQVDSDGVELTVFFGTWCGDSRREVPRLLKLADTLGLDEEAVQLVAVDRAEGALKRSPGGEEQGLEIYRVPTVIVHRDGAEIARIVEYPALSLERDLLTILSGSDYQPSYASYPVVRQWLDEGLLADANVSPDGLADQVRRRISSESELAAPAKVLLDRGQTDEAIKLYEVNCALHWQSASAHARLATAQLAQGDLDAARKSVKRALRRNDDPEALEALMELLEKTGGMPEEASAGVS